MIVFALGCALAVIVFPYLSPIASGSDQSGYLNFAKLLHEGRFSLAIRGPEGAFYRSMDPQLWHTLGFEIRPDKRSMVPTYPVGMPLQFAAAIDILGSPNGIRLVQLLVFSGSFVLMVLLFRQLGISRVSSIVGGLALVFCTLFFLMAVQCMSDANSTFWALAVMTSALAAIRCAGGRCRFVCSTLCGFCLGIAVLTRAPNALLILPVLVLFGLRWGEYLGLFMGGLVPALFYFWSNQILYGHAIATGYGGLNSLFKWSYFLPNMGHMSLWTTALVSPVVVAGILVALCFREIRRNRFFLALVVWEVAYLLFYSFYFYTGETWWYLRFVLPAFPAVIAVGLWGWDSMGRRLGNRRRFMRFLLPGLVAVLIAANHMYWMNHFKPFTTFRGENKYVKAANWVKSHVSSKGILFCMQFSGSMLYYTPNPILRWDTGPPKLANAVLGHAHDVDHLPIYAILFPFERKQVWKRFPRSEWIRVQNIEDVEIFRFSPDGRSE